MQQRIGCCELLEYHAPDMNEGYSMSKRKLSLVALVAGSLLASGAAWAWSAKKIDREVAEATEVFKEEVTGSEVLLNTAAGYLVFPRQIPSRP